MSKSGVAQRLTPFTNSRIKLGGVNEGLNALLIDVLMTVK